jgi:hypothetical protein
MLKRNAGEFMREITREGARTLSKEITKSAFSSGNPLAARSGNQKNFVTPSSSTTTRSLIPAARASLSSSCRGSSTGSCESRNVP